MDLKITTMTLTDLNEISDILISDFDDFWTFNTLEEELNCDNSFFLVAKSDDNDIVGFAGFKSIFDEADIMNIVVKKNYRNNGVRFFFIRKFDFICKKT